jgi:hypothetical protein
MEARWYSRKLEEFGALRNERVHQKENNPGVCARSRVGGVAISLGAVLAIFWL